VGLPPLDRPEAVEAAAAERPDGRRRARLPVLQG
jgi:hypothetical protein